MDMTGRAVTGELQHRRPEQRVEIEDVLTDEVDKLRVRSLFYERVEIDGLALSKVFKAAEIADRRIEPDIEILAGCIRDLKTEVGRVARNVPIVEALLEP